MKEVRKKGEIESKVRILKNYGVLVSSKEKGGKNGKGIFHHLINERAEGETTVS